MQLKFILCPIDCSGFSAATYQYTLSLAEYYKAGLLFCTLSSCGSIHSPIMRPMRLTARNLPER